MPKSLVPPKSRPEERKAYYDELAHRCREAKFYKVKKGEFPGQPPVGYRNGTFWKGEPAITVDEASAPFVKESFSLAAEGKLAVRELLKAMTAKGLRSRRGYAMTVSAFWRMLTNPFYTGRIRYLGGIVPGSHEPLVTDEVFAKVLEQLEHRRSEAAAKTRTLTQDPRSSN